jgi:hypothetical protein
MRYFSAYASVFQWQTHHWCAWQESSIFMSYDHSTGSNPSANAVNTTAGSAMVRWHVCMCVSTSADTTTFLLLSPALLGLCPKWHPFPYIVHYKHSTLWRNRVPFGMQTEAHWGTWEKWVVQLGCVQATLGTRKLDFLFSRKNRTIPRLRDPSSRPEGPGQEGEKGKDTQGPTLYCKCSF